MSANGTGTSDWLKDRTVDSGVAAMDGGAMGTWVDSDADALSDWRGGAIFRGSTGSRLGFWAAHFAARPFRGLLVLYSW